MNQISPTVRDKAWIYLGVFLGRQWAGGLAASQFLDFNCNRVTGDRKMIVGT